MSKLHDFLHPIAAGEEKDVVISTRFVQHDDAGEPILDDMGRMLPRPFRIRAISQAESDRLMERCTRKVRGKSGQTVRDFDTAAYMRGLIVLGTVDPDFSLTELCNAYGTAIPEEVPGKMLYTGEYQRLADAIAELSGINMDAEEEAKN